MGPRHFELIASRWAWIDFDTGARVWIPDQMRKGLCYGTFYKGKPVAWILCYR